MRYHVLIFNEYLFIPLLISNILDIFVDVLHYTKVVTCPWRLLMHRDCFSARLICLLSYPLMPCSSTWVVDQAPCIMVAMWNSVKINTNAELFTDSMKCSYSCSTQFSFLLCSCWFCRFLQVRPFADWEVLISAGMNDKKKKYQNFITCGEVSAISFKPNCISWVEICLEWSSCSYWCYSYHIHTLMTSKQFPVYFYSLKIK